jgi:hypothetical protein
MAMHPIKTVAVSELDLRLETLRLNCPRQLERIRQSMARDGQRTPVVVATGVAEKDRILIDGFKRVCVLREQGAQEVQAVHLPLDEKGAKAAMVACNAPHHGLCAIEEGWVVKALCRGDGLKQLEVAKLLRRAPSWVCRRLKLVEQLDDELVLDLRLGLLSTTVARQLSELPRGNQHEVAQVAREHGLSSRQVAALLQTLKANEDPEQRRAVLADPLQWLSSSGPAKSGRVGDELVRRLLSWEEVSLSVDATLRRHLERGITAERRRRLGPIIEQAIQAAQRVTEAIKRLRPPSASPSPAPVVSPAPVRAASPAAAEMSQQECEAALGKLDAMGIRLPGAAREIVLGGAGTGAEPR